MHQLTNDVSHQTLPCVLDDYALPSMFVNRGTVADPIYFSLSLLTNVHPYFSGISELAAVVLSAPLVDTNDCE
jgi:hypothetical protein